MNENVKRKPYIKYIIAGVVCFLFLIIITLLIYFLTRKKKGIPFYLTYGGGGIWYSNDGMKWTNCFKESVYDIAYNGVDTFLAVGLDKVFYSNDGKNWTLYASNIFGIGSTGGSGSIIAYNGVDTWVVGCNNTTGNNLAYSNDRKKWTPVTNIFVNGSVSSIVYNGVDTWVAVGSSICYSNDGKIWTPITIFFDGYFLGYNGVDTWVAVGDGDDKGSCLHSKDGKIWTQVKNCLKYGYYVAYNGVDTWVAVGYTQKGKGGSSICYSKDGVNWNNGTNIFPLTQGNSLAYNGLDTWVSVGGGPEPFNQGVDPTTCYSKDGGLTWNKGTDIFSGGSGLSVAYNGVDTWVASGIVNNRSVVAYSKDGIVWTIGTGINDSNYLNSVKIFTLK
jgi:hypothetical protein